MNVKLKVLSAAVLAGSVGTAAAGGYPAFMPPVWLLIQQQAAGLTVPEKAAYSAIEAALQTVEAQIYTGQTGCARANMEVTVFVNQAGQGFIDVQSLASDLTLNVSPLAQSDNLGFKYRVAGGGMISGDTVANYVGISDFDVPGGVMTLSNSMIANRAGISGKVIKDFYLHGAKSDEAFRNDPRSGCAKNGDSCEADPRPVIIDWGLQSLAKSGYTQTKYFQWSRSTRSDDFASTRIWKKRIYNAFGTSACTIKFTTKGQNDGEGFYQTGTLKVRPSDAYGSF